MRRLTVGVVVGAMTLAACMSAGSRSERASSTTRVVSVTSARGQSSGELTAFAVDSRGLHFSLPTAFAKIDDPSFVFLARSQDPRAVFSIDSDSPAVVDHAARAGERLSDLKIDGVKTVVVNHAAVDGLPPGIEANELLVANGARSFSVIMSSAVADLPRLWTSFMGSVSFK